MTKRKPRYKKGAYFRFPGNSPVYRLEEDIHSHQQPAAYTNCQTGRLITFTLKQGLMRCKKDGSLYKLSEGQRIAGQKNFLKGRLASVKHELQHVCSALTTFYPEYVDTINREKLYLSGSIEYLLQLLTSRGT